MLVCACSAQEMTKVIFIAINFIQIKLLPTATHPNNSSPTKKKYAQRKDSPIGIRSPTLKIHLGRNNKTARCDRCTHM